MVMVLPRRGLFALLPFSRKSVILALLLLPSVIMWLYHLIPALRNGILQPIASSSASSITAHPQQNALEAPSPIDLAVYPYDQQNNISVNLVIATIAEEDISWTSRLQIPNLNIIRYVSDDQTARYHPPVAKGREALMYHTYMYDFYETLPDITIFIHADESPWHADAELWSSMLFTLSNLDLGAVLERGYANLRVSWYQACPAWINTTKTPEESIKQEEPWMAFAFRANFGDDVQVPEILAGPCCSQFAVTREAIRTRERDVYARAMSWLIETDWSDYIVGRTWEHMWSWLFKQEPRDCPVEWKTFCRMYGVCFEGTGDLEEFRALWKERKMLVEKRNFWFELWDPQRAETERARIRELDVLLDARLRMAMERGRQGTAARQQRLGDMYADDTPFSMFK